MFLLAFDFQFQDQILSLLVFVMLERIQVLAPDLTSIVKKKIKYRPRKKEVNY